MTCVHGLNGAWSSMWSKDQCRPCWSSSYGNGKATHSERDHGEDRRVNRRAKPRTIIVNPFRADCIELGPVIVETPRCGTKIRRCSLHGKCTTEPNRKGLHACDQCDDYRGQDSSVIEPETQEVAAVLKDIDGPEQVRDDAWLRSTAVQAAHRIAARRYLNTLDDYTDDLSGRGVVLVGGGRYAAGIYLHIRLLRELGSNLPVQVWHRGDSEDVPDIIREMPGVEVIDADTHPRCDSWRSMGGWQLKMIAVINSGWKEVIFSDADNYPVANPEVCFDHNPTGAVLWPDIASNDAGVKWDIYGVQPPRHNEGTNGGSAVYDLSRCWKACNLAAWYDAHSEFYYRVGGYGDQDQVRAAFAVSGTPYALYARRPVHDNDRFIQPGPNGKPLWIHRIGRKPGKNHVPVPRLPLEGRVFEILKEFHAP